MPEQLGGSDQIAGHPARQAKEASGKKGPAFWMLLAAASVLFLGMLNVFWVGFLGSDDVSYWEGSTGWLHHFPYLGGDHWTLRHALVVPIALFRLIFGNNSVSLFLPTILYAEGLIAVIGIWTWRSSGASATIAALLFVVTYPQVIIYSSTADIDVIELFFVFCAFFLLGSVITNARSAPATDGALSAPDRRRLIIAGGFLGFGLLSRETAAFAIVAVTILCLTQYGLARKYYLLVLVGLTAVVGLEMLYLWGQSGHLFYRYSLDAHHDSNINRWTDQGAAIPIVNPAVDPFTMLFLNHNFGLVSWVALPLSIWLFRRDDLQERERTLIVLLGTLALAWTVLSAALWKSLVLIPRYYVLPSVCILVLAGLALGRMWHDGRRWLPCMLGVLLVSSNLIALSLDNRNVMFAEYKLVELAVQRNYTIYADQHTLHRAELLLDWANVRKRVTADPVRRGDLVFINPMRPYPGLVPAKDWKIIYESPVPLSGGHLIACSVPKQLTPKEMLGMHGCGREILRLYRVGTVR